MSPAPEHGSEAGRAAPVGATGNAQEHVKALERDLAQARAMLEDFAHSVSHDLRAPLRHVTSYLKIIREDLGDTVTPDIAAHLKTASDAAALIGQQMDALLQLSRLGRAELHLQDVDLNRLLVDLLRQPEHQCPGRRVDWQLDAALPVVRADVALLGPALAHLMTNALRFSQMRDPAVIRVTAGPGSDAMVDITVADNGMGFAPRFAGRLFTVFQRIHAGPPTDGIGLGLAYVRAVAERHGGRVRAQGSPDQGCQVTISLPAARGA